ncbi:hypothetical protein FACS189491_11320 [Spirochaetia bacterium]|nr:hypothetical protein FACS189491_11320 [Spirochaetia bacterium]
MKKIVFLGLFAVFFSILSCGTNNKKQEDIVEIEYDEDELNKIHSLGRAFLATGGDPAVKASLDTAKEKYKDYYYFDYIDGYLYLLKEDYSMAIKPFLMTLLADVKKPKEKVPFIKLNIAICFDKLDSKEDAEIFYHGAIEGINELILNEENEKEKNMKKAIKAKIYFLMGDDLGYNTILEELFLYQDDEIINDLQNIDKDEVLYSLIFIDGP